MINYKIIFLEICFNEMPNGKNNERLTVSTVRAFHPINVLISILHQVEKYDTKTIFLP